MLKPILFLILGLLLLIKGGDWFVSSASNIAKLLKIPELIIGATLVSLCTTLPEVLVSSKAALQSNAGIAYGNAIGSIICNTALICALVCVFAPQFIQKSKVKLAVVFFSVASIGYALVAYFGTFTRGIGILLLGVFGTYTVLNVRNTIRLNGSDMQNAAKSSDSSVWRELGLLGIGIAAVVLGADLLVDNGTVIAELAGVPESVIGLTVVALGTSLPELVTAVTSIVKGHGELSVGNIIGANLFNLVYVSGLAITIKPFDVPMDKQIGGMNASLVVDIPLMFLVMGILVVPILARGRISRWQGLVLLGIYGMYVVFQFWM